MPTVHDPQMLKGVLAFLLLSLLSNEDGYGYGIVTRLRNVGFPELREGTVYPALARLEAAGHLTSYLAQSDSGPARKYYRTTSSGREELADRARAWASLVAAVELATGSSPTTTPSTPTGETP